MAAFSQCSSVRFSYFVCIDETLAYLGTGGVHTCDELDYILRSGSLSNALVKGATILQLLDASLLLLNYMNGSFPDF